MGHFLFARFFAVVNLFLGVARAFSVSTGPASQCDEFLVSWAGGTPPFSIILVPEYTIFTNVSVPSSAFTDNQGSYAIPILPLAANKRFVVVMSDATGFGSGGVSDIITVGGSVENIGCNTTSQGPNFFYESPNTGFQQCGQYTYENYLGATQPISITALVPGGGSVVTQAPDSTILSYSWPIDVTAGTSLILFLTDATGAQGGTTYIWTVSSSGNSSCLTGSYPSSTTEAPSPTSAASQMSSQMASPSSSSNNSNTDLSTGVIAGIAIGGAAVLIAFAALMLCCCRPRDTPLPLTRPILDMDPDQRDLNSPFTPHIFPFQPEYPSQHTPPMAQYLNAVLRPRTYDPNSQNFSSSNSLQQTQFTSNAISPLGSEYTANSPVTPGGHWGVPTNSDSSRPSTQFLVHTDVEDARPGDVDFVELPPGYLSGRQPIPIMIQSWTRD
ncbi:hypothetical protein BV22DRAFT_1134887 [Leucogyrophana mollusca]|uniref:Uncharacterized protein n=1 Tax=Leucogyrophana mollusca TaxID=85980 RepID=A0ACB8B043_9AGAM|nr:hypothetical protein BV22DRAFT_1134887 [Leucogyrophana mollusca]